MSKKQKQDQKKEQGQVLIQERPKSRTHTKKPSLYQVLLHNDDFTTMEFVVHLLMKHFHKSEVEATEIMLKVHSSGVGIAGIYTYEISETKVLLVTEEARRKEFPLKVTLERAG